MLKATSYTKNQAFASMLDRSGILKTACLAFMAPWFLLLNKKPEQDLPLGNQPDVFKPSTIQSISSRYSPSPKLLLLLTGIVPIALGLKSLYNVAILLPVFYLEKYWSDRNSKPTFPVIHNPTKDIFDSFGVTSANISDATEEKAEIDQAHPGPSPAPITKVTTGPSSDTKNAPPYPGPHPGPRTFH